MDKGGITLSYACLHCHRYPLKNYIWRVSSGHGDGNNSKKKHCNWWCAACGGQHDWENPNRVSVIQDNTDRSEAKVFRARIL